MKLQLVESGGTGPNVPLDKGQKDPEQPDEKPDPEKTPRELKLALAALQRGDFSGAERLAHTAAVDHGCLEAHAVWYRAATREEHPMFLTRRARRRAPDILKPLLEAEPSRRLSLTLCKCTAPNDPLVREHLARAHERHPTDPNITEAYSKALAADGQHLRGLLVWRHALAERRPEALWRAGRALSRSDRPLRALTAFELIESPTHSHGLDARLAAAVVCLSAGRPDWAEHWLPADRHSSTHSKLLREIVATRVATEQGDAKTAWQHWRNCLERWCELGGSWPIRPPRLAQAPGLRLDLTPSMAAAWRLLRPLTRYKAPASAQTKARHRILAATINEQRPNPSDLQAADHPCFARALAEHYLSIGELYSATGCFARYARQAMERHEPVTMPETHDDLAAHIDVESSTQLKSVLRLARRRLTDAYAALPYYRTVLRHVFQAVGDARGQLAWARWLSRLDRQAPDLAADAGLAAARLGRPRQAAGYLLHAHRVWPHDQETGMALAFCLERTGASTDEVVSIYQHLADANPDNATIRVRYEAVMKRRGA